MLETYQNHCTFHKFIIHNWNANITVDMHFSNNKECMNGMHSRSMQGFDGLAIKEHNKIQF